MEGNRAHSADSPGQPRLTALGSSQTAASKNLETFPNRHPDREYMVSLDCPEFTCVCPITGQPDFGRIAITYVPAERVLESKSLKLYLWSYRNEGAFHEHVVNTILDDVVAATQPRACRVTGAFNVRGGISITVEAESGGPGGAIELLRRAANGD